MKTMNPRIAPLSNDAAPAASTKILESVHAAVGMVPNLHRTLAHAPAALETYVLMSQTLGKGALDARLRESLAISTAATNGCGYCASAHTAIGRGLKIDALELARNLDGTSADPRTAAALEFARALTDTRGDVTDEQIEALRDAGFDEEQLVEIVAHVGMNSFSNMFNVLARTTIDFPRVDLQPA
jgi:uncharacterized peroxidase-related enzyme